MTTSTSPGTVRLNATEPGHIALAEAARLFSSDAAEWLGEPAGDPPSGMRRFATELRLRPDDHGFLSNLHKSAYVDLGPSQRVGDGLRVEISWRAATLAPLFPVFSGWLTVRPGELQIDGYYAPPGGAIGLVADRALLHLAARGTARWLLRQLLQAAAHWQPASPPHSTPQDPSHLS